MTQQNENDGNGEDGEESNVNSAAVKPRRGNKKSRNGNGGDQCSEAGFFQSSKNCHKFYRCVDFGGGKLTKFNFDCPGKY